MGPVCVSTSSIVDSQMDDRSGVHFCALYQYYNFSIVIVHSHDKADIDNLNLEWHELGRTALNTRGRYWGVCVIGSCKQE